MKSLVKTNDKVTVFAARSGLSVEAITDMVERMTRMRSLLHNGQFYERLARAYAGSFRGENYKWVIGVVGGLRNKKSRDWPALIVLQPRVDILK